MVFVNIYEGGVLLTLASGVSLVSGKFGSDPHSGHFSIYNILPVGAIARNYVKLASSF